MRPFNDTGPFFLKPTYIQESKKATSVLGVNMGLTAAEIVDHPAFSQNVIWDLKPTVKAKCPVAKGRGGPFNLMYEIHGTGPVHIIVST